MLPIPEEGEAPVARVLDFHASSPARPSPPAKASPAATMSAGTAPRASPAPSSSYGVPPGARARALSTPRTRRRPAAGPPTARVARVLRPLVQGHHR
jgi:hypothetical protein